MLVYVCLCCTMLPSLANKSIHITLALYAKTSLGERHEWEETRGGWDGRVLSTATQTSSTMRLLSRTRSSELWVPVVSHGLPSPSSTTTWDLNASRVLNNNHSLWSYNRWQYRKVNIILIIFTKCSRIYSEGQLTKKIN